MRDEVGRQSQHGLLRGKGGGVFWPLCILSVWGGGVMEFDSVFTIVCSIVTNGVCQELCSYHVSVSFLDLHEWMMSFIIHIRSIDLSDACILYIGQLKPAVEEVFRSLTRAATNDCFHYPLFF